MTTFPHAINKHIAYALASDDCTLVVGTVGGPGGAGGLAVQTRCERVAHLVQIARAVLSDAEERIEEHLAREGSYNQPLADLYRRVREAIALLREEEE